MNRNTFEKLVWEGFEEIPEKFRKFVDNVALLIEDEPSAAVREEECLDGEETLFGRYVGVPKTERGAGYGVGGTLPDTITIYQKPIEEEAGEDPDTIREIVYDTVWHEIAHHFGIDEFEVRRREAHRKK